MSKRQSSFMLIVSLLISGVVFLQMGLYLISILAGWNVRFNLVEVCHSWIKAFGLSSLEYVLDGFVVYTLLFAIWKIGLHWFHAARMKKRFELYKENALTIAMNQTYNSGKKEIIVISYPAPVAITVGLSRPKIVVSTGLMSLLNDDELTAVVYHEMYHKESRDPLKIYLLSLCSSTLWYIPILKWCHQKYRIVNELLADGFAIEKQATSVNLGSALLKMLKVGKQETMPFAYASFADTSVNYRIDYIVNPFMDIQLKLPRRVVFLSAMIFSLICALFIYALA
ncbi:M56 family metallopeptidase [Sporosarcina sp. FSL W7-1349]|uniref:M56 family metallopeptidase n=1 Tax=Sporosarcina sp. FSL W7-1349 TaxID=2921561 RepID=UPI0030F84D5E